MSRKKYYQTRKNREAEEEAAAVEPALNKLPKLPPYDKALFYSLSIPDLLADLLLIVFAFFVSDELFSNTGVFMYLEHWQIAAMYCIVVLTLPWYLGYVYVRNSAFYSDKVMKFFLWTFVLMTVMILVYLIRLIVTTDFEEHEGINGWADFTAVVAIFLLILGPMMCMGGAASAYNSFSEDGDAAKRFNPDRGMATYALLMIVLAIGFMIYFVGLFPADSTWGPIIAYLGGPFAAVIVFAIFMMFLTFLDKIGIYKYLAIFAQNSFPLFIITVLVFWSGIAIHFMNSDFASGSGKLSMGGMWFSIIISGLVPFRILMLFNAPLRIKNIVIGIASLSYFLVQMILLTR